MDVGKGNRKKIITISLDEKTLELLEEFCIRENRSRSNGIEAIIINYLNK